MSKKKWSVGLCVLVSLQSLLCATGIAAGDRSGVSSRSEAVSKAKNKASMDVARRPSDDESVVDSAAAAPGEVGVEAASDTVEQNDSAARVYAAAYALYEEARYRDVIGLIDREIAADPEAATIENQLLRGYAYVGLDDQASTLAAARAALAIEPEHGEALSMAANALSLIGDKAAALTHYAKAIERDEPSARLYNNYMKTLADSERWADIKALLARYEKQKEDGEFEDADEFENDVLFYASLAYDKTGDGRKAIELLDAAIEQSPDFAGYYINRGNLYIDIRDFPKALSDLNRAIALDPKDGMSYYGRGRAFLEMKAYPKAVDDFLMAKKKGFRGWFVENNLGNAYRKAGKSSEALDAYRRALEIDPGNAMVKNNLAVLQGELGMKQASTASYLEAEAGNGDTSIPLYNRAFDLFKDGKCAEAIPLLQKALKIRPDFPDAENQIGACFIKLDRFDEAVNVLTSAIERHPESPMLHANLASAQVERGNIALAEQAYLKALEVAPEMVDLYYQIAAMHFKRGDSAKAAGYFVSAQSAGVVSREFHIDYMAYLLSSGNAGQAIAIGEAGLSRYPRDRELQINLAGAYSGSGRATKAESLLKKAVDLYPEDASALNNLGNLYLSTMGEPEKAIEYLAAAVRADGKRMLSRLNLAQAYVAVSDHGNAEKEYATLVQSFPDEPGIYFARANFRSTLGQTSLERADLEKGIALAERRDRNQLRTDSQSNLDLLSHMADAKQKLGRCAEAVRDYQAYLAFEKHDAQAYANSAYCRMELGDLRQAAIEFESSYALDRDGIDALLGLFVSHSLLGDRAKSRKFRQLAESRLKWRLDADTLQKLADDGYFYSTRFSELWRDAVAH